MYRQEFDVTVATHMRSSLPDAEVRSHLHRELLREGGITIREVDYVDTAGTIHAHMQIRATSEEEASRFGEEAVYRAIIRTGAQITD